MPIFRKLISIIDKVDVNTGLSMEVDKPYLLLLLPTDTDDSEFASGEWKALRGRKEVYDYLMDYVATGNYVLVKSFVLSGGITFGNEVTIYTFLRLCIEKFQYGTKDDLDNLDQMAIETANMIDITTNLEQLDKLYMNELSQRSK